MHFVWDVLLDELLPPPESERAPKGSFQEFFRIVVDGKPSLLADYHRSPNNISNTPPLRVIQLQNRCSLALPLLNASTGASSSFRKLFHGSRPQTCRCFSRRTLCGLGSTTCRTSTDICIASQNRLSVSSSGLCSCFLLGNPNIRCFRQDPCSRSFRRIPQ